MSLKDTLSQGLEALYEVAVGGLETAYEAAEELIDTYLPDDNVQGSQDKAEALAAYYEAKGYSADVVDTYRSGKVPDALVNLLYTMLIEPDAAVKETPPPAPTTPDEYLSHLKRTNPLLARVYENTLRNQKQSNPFRNSDGFKYSDPEDDNLF